MDEIGFCHGALADSYEKQAAEQGFTFGKNKHWIQSVGDGIIRAHGHGCITDAEYDRILRRFHNKILVKNIKPLKEGGSNDTNGVDTIT